MPNLAPSRPQRQPAPFAAGYIPSVAAIMEGFVVAEGPYTVRGRYYACATDAARWRQHEAEVLHGAAMRGHEGALRECRQLTAKYAQSVLLAHVCPMCNGQIGDRDPVVATGGRLLHEGCGAALDVILAVR